MKKLVALLSCMALLGASLFCTPVYADDSITVRVGIYENNPKIFTDNEGNAAGFWVDLIEYIASQEGWQIEYVHGTWAQCLDRLENNEIDMLPDVAYSEARSQLYDFSDEVVYTSWSGIYAGEGAGIQSIVDLDGKNVAVLEGSVNVEGPEGIKALVSSFGISCSFIEVDSYIRVFELVESGEADAGVTSKDFGGRHMADYNIVKTGIIFQPSLLYFAFPKDSTLSAELIERIDYHMTQLKTDEDSIYYQSLEGWLGMEAVERAVVPEWLKWLLIAVAGLAVLLAGGGYILSSQVKSRTRELTDEVGQRKRAEEKYSTLVEQSNDGIIIIQDGLLKFANIKMLQISGYTMEEAIGKSFLDFVAPVYKPMVMENYRKRILGEPAPNKYEIEMMTKDGRHTPAEINASRIEYEGKFADMAIIRDITERKVMESAVRQSEEKCRAIFEAAKDGILVTDVKSRAFNDGNKAICRMTGYSLDELKKMGVKDIHPEKDLPSIYRKFEVQAEGRYSLLLDVPVKRKDGSIFYADINSAPVSYGGKTFLMGMFRDATERRQIEERLRKLSRAVEQSPAVVMVTDTKGVIEYVNPRFEQITGYTSQEVIGKEAEELGLFLQEDSDRMWAMLGSGEEWRGEFHNRKKDGELYWELASISSLKDENGDITHFVKVAEDITERKQMEEQLMLTDRLASIGQLASGIAHELNNPLTGVIGLSELIMEKDAPEDIKEDLEVINKEAQRTAGIVRGLLTFARKQGAEKVSVDINGIIQGILQLRSYEQKVNNIEITTDFDPDLPRVIGNGSQLQQVFMNIILNAEQAMLEANGRGTISITTEECDGMVRASIADDGPGISPANMRKLFTPFFTTKEVGKGTGLGLSICHGIVTEHGGKIHAESVPGKGACFILELPVAAEGNE